MEKTKDNYRAYEEARSLHRQLLPVSKLIVRVDFALVFWI